MLLDCFVGAKVYAQRSLIYYQLVQYILIIILFLRPYELNFWVELVLISVIAALAILIGWVDTKSKILQKEQGRFNRENKEVMEIIEQLKRIEAKLE